MNSDNNLLHQADTLQQPPLTKKSSNITWIGFSILLIAVNLVFGWIITYLGVVAYPLFVFLLIIDFFTILSYANKQPPPWKALFVYLLVVNVIFVSWAGYVLSHRGPTADLSGLGILFFSLPLAIIDFIALFSYIITQRLQGITKVTGYTVFIAISFVLIFIALEVIFFWLMGQ